MATPLSAVTGVDTTVPAVFSLTGAMELGVISLSDIQTDPATGRAFLPVLDPVRVYQDFATVDLVSGGRAEIAVGRSAFTEPFGIFGADLRDYDALFTEKLDLLLQLREHDHVTWSGKFRPPLHDAPVTPRARQKPLPVWLGVGGSPQSAERAGHLGLPSSASGSPPTSTRALPRRLRGRFSPTTTNTSVPRPPAAAGSSSARLSSTPAPNAETRS
ncbi:MAG: LLM class flavin-dependent oxidoreductase [Streptosporangiaceae bacterium]